MYKIVNECMSRIGGESSPYKSVTYVAQGESLNSVTFAKTGKFALVHVNILKITAQKIGARQIASRVQVTQKQRP